MRECLNPAWIRASLKIFYALATSFFIDPALYDQHEAMEQSVDEPFSVLPVELRSIIYGLCQKEDLKNLSLCNKWLRDDVVPLMWKNVCVKWATLSKFTPQKRTSSMSFISHLTFSRWFAGIRELRDYISYGFAFFLQCCNHDKLTSIVFKDSIPSGALRLIGEMLPNLQYLELHMLEADWVDLQQLPTTLQSLIIRYCSDFREEDWAVIWKMKQLQILELIDYGTRSSVRLPSASEFKLNNLVKLNLLRTGKMNTLLMKIASTCTRLEDLTISDRRSDASADVVTDSDVMVIAQQLKSLKRLTLYQCGRVTNASIVFLSIFSSLEELVINCCNCDELDASCLRYIGRMKSLKELYIIEPRYIEPTDEDFAHLGNLTSLKTLVLCYFPHLTDASLEVIGTLKCMVNLNISNCTGFTDEGLVHLAALPHLRKLVCNYEDGDYEEIMKITLAGLNLYGLSQYLVDEIE